MPHPFSNEGFSMQSNIHYVHFLASQTGTDISSWDIPALIEGIPDNDRRAVNQVFMVKSMQAPPMEETQDYEGIVNAATLAFKSITSKRLYDLNLRRASYLRKAHEYYDMYQGQLSAAYRSLEDADLLRGANIQADLLEGLKRISNSPFWQFFVSSGAAITLRTRQAIILSQKNEAAGIDITLNFGLFEATLDIFESSIVVKPAGLNINCHGYSHPYISRVGEICWGNAAATARDLLASRKYPQVFDLLASLLSTYHHDTTPYQRLTDFSRVVGNPEPRQEDGRVWCDGCEEARADCDCGEWCSVCDQSQDDCECRNCSECEDTVSERESTYCQVCDSTFCSRHSCDCCGECESSADNCDCCRECEQTSDNCDCCRECDRTAENCERCRECDSHEHVQHPAEPESEIAF